MPKYQIPKSAGQFHIRTSIAGTPIIWNKKKGKGKERWKNTPANSKYHK